MTLKNVFKPIKLGSCTIPNRVVFTAHSTGFAYGSVSDQQLAYHEARAKGGVGLDILEILSVHPTSPQGRRGRSLIASAKNLAEGYQNLMAAVKPHGMRVFQELWHGGHHAIPEDGSWPLSASDIPSATAGVVPQPMTRGQVQEIVEAFANAARLCEEGGLDGVELHGAHGFLIQQFMSPLTNKRTDEYGGGFKNRIRFKLEVLGAIRAAVSKDFVVGIRLSPEMTPGGLDSQENARIVKVLQAEGLLDYSSIELLSSPVRTIGETAVVVDDVGHFEAAGVAEYLIEKGVAVTLVTRHREFAPLMVPALRARPALERLGRGNFILMTRAHLSGDRNEQN